MAYPPPKHPRHPHHPHSPRAERPHAPRSGSGSHRPHAPHPPREPRPRERAFHICGFPAVSALFQQRPQAVERLYFDDRMKTRTGPFCHLLAAHRKTYRLVEGDELARIAGTSMHGGIVAVAPPRPCRILDEAEAPGWAKAGAPLLILDGIGNPHNLGAIARSAAFFGLTRLLLSAHPGQAQPSEAAYRVAEGGFEFLDLIQVPDLPKVLRRLAPLYRVVATALEQAKPFTTFAPGKPIALVLGNEEDGLPPATLAACPQRITLPPRGPIQSLNVAATAAIFIHALSVTGSVTGGAGGAGGAGGMCNTGAP